MGGLPFHYVELRTFAYATEARERVEEALRTLLPPEAELGVADSEGHHGDPITIYSVRVEATDGIVAVIDRLADLPDEEYRTVLAELEERIDEDCNLFVSLSKQAAYRGKVRLGEGITLRAKVEAYPAKHATAVENARTALGES